MPRDLRQVLHDTAVQPSGDPDVDRIVRRGVRRRRLRHTTAAVGATAAVLMAVVVGVTAAIEPAPPGIVDEPPPASEVPSAPPAVSEEPTAGPSRSPADAVPSGPSQSAEDAARDGVMAEVAALAFSERVDVRDPMHEWHTARVETEEGIWVVSRLHPLGEARAEGCGLGATDDPDAVYRRDVICTVEYGEVLLLDHAEEEILQAFPLPGVPPQRLSVSDDAVWCSRQGDGGLPDGMLCRIDRQTFDWQVRVFPHHTGTAFTTEGDAGSGVDPATGELWVPDNWTVDEGPVRYSQSFLAGRWSFEGSTLVASSQGALRYDPTSLAPIPPCGVDVATETAASGNDVVLTTTITLVAGEACGLDAHVGHGLHDPDGWPLPTEGIASQPTQDVIRPAEPLRVHAVWSNWCGDQEPSEVLATVGPFGDWSSPITSVPACEDSSAPSRLEATPGS